MTVGLNERWVHLQNKWIYILHSESWFLNLYPFVFLEIPLVRPDSCPFFLVLFLLGGPCRLLYVNYMFSFH